MISEIFVAYILGSVASLTFWGLGLLGIGRRHLFIGFGFFALTSFVITCMNSRTPPASAIGIIAILLGIETLFIGCFARRCPLKGKSHYPISLLLIILGLLLSLIM